MFVKFFLISAIAISLTQSPMEKIRSTIDRMLHTIKSTELQGESHKIERRIIINNLLSDLIDFREMAKRSLGKHWKRHTERQEEFVSLFTQFMEYIYSDRVLNTLGLATKNNILYLKERVDGNYAAANTRFVLRNNIINLNYKMHRVGGSWKAYDIVVNNVSLVNVYRAQFDRVIRKKSFDELIEIMKAKIEKLGS